MNQTYSYSYSFKINKSSIFLLLLFVYQYVILGSCFYNLRFGSANLQITLITLLFISCAFLQWKKIIKNLGGKVVLVLALGIIFIPLKMLLGQLGISGLQSMRLFYILPLFWSLYRVYANEDNIKDKVVTIIIWNCFFIAIFGIVHFFFFPDALLGYPAIDEGKSIWSIPGHRQEAAFFGNPSAYGCILLTGLLGIYLSKKESLLYNIIFIVIFLGILLSVSRWAILLSIVLLVVFLKDNFRLRMLTLIQLFFVSMLTIFILSKFPFFLLTFQYAYAKWGFSTLISGGSIATWATPLASGRFPGYEVALQILFSDISHFLLGGLLTDTFISDDIVFSDNSFIFLAIKYGVPIAILWILTVLFKMVPLRLKGGKKLFLLVFFYGTIFSTPALFWDLWVLYFLGILNFADSKSSFSLQHTKHADYGKHS